MREYRRLTERLIKPDLGRLRLGRITTKRLDDYDATLSKEHGLSPATIRHVHAVFRGAFGQAVKWGIVPMNPAASASPPKLRSREINPPVIADVKRMLELADDDDPEYGALLRVLTATGARRGEVCGLRWSDVDRSTRTLSITRSIASVAGTGSSEIQLMLPACGVSQPRSSGPCSLRPVIAKLYSKLWLSRPPPFAGRALPSTLSWSRP